MSRGGALMQPVGQKILSNVSVVKLKRKGKQFEIAVLPNKVSSWRNGLEPDIDEVVQSHSIFVNVDQGMLAKKSDVLQALDCNNMEEALEIILKQGTMRLAAKERKIVIANLTKDIASIVASQCVNVNTERPLTSTTVERAMKEIGYSVKITRAAKAQALTVIRELKERGYPIARARIRLIFYIKNELADKMISMIPIVEKVEQADEDTKGVIAQVDPGSIRSVASRLAEEFGTDIKIDILELYVAPTATNEEETGIEVEVENENEEDIDDGETEENKEK